MTQTIPRMNVTFLQNVERMVDRAFAYLDVISWVESKVYDKPMGTVIQEKYLASKRRK